MATVVDELAPAPAPSPRVESLGESVALLLAAAVVQRMIGFARSVFFCRWLAPEELGQWDLAFGFFSLAAPLAVIGLPGSFGRYLEHYRRRGQFQRFLKRTTLVSLGSAVVVVSLIASRPDYFGWLVFGRAEWGVVETLACSLLAVVGFNYLAELFAGLRQFRVVSAMNFRNSLLFAVLGTGLIAVWPTALAVVAAYGVACALSCLLALPALRAAWRQAPVAPEGLVRGEVWRKLAPFAAWLWVTNMLANLFDIVDRTMLVHCSGMAEHVALAEVGVYHSSRVVPLLLVSLAAMLAQTTTPHLSHDWEAGRQDRVGERLNLILKVAGLGLTAGSAVILVAGPFLFDTLFEGKYAGGMAVLPWTLVYCVWSGMTTVAATYLWCAERARLMSLALAVGLVVNVLLNLLLAPTLGLKGVVLATATANFIALSITYLFGHWLGWRIDSGTIVVSLLPLLLPCGAWAVGLALAAALGQATRCDWVFDPREKRQLFETAGAVVARLRTPRGSAPA
ncbi:MAG: lipopolysaccharide biosynthesis protein [Pirellulales bacterium]